MIVLTIDTCEENTTIELNKNGKVFTTNLLKEESTSECLLVKLEELLLGAKAELKDVNLIGVCTGPGSFTGVRIALSCVKGLVCGLKNTKIVAVNTFQKIAYKNNITTNAIIVLPSGNADIYYAVLNSDNSYIEVIEEGFATSESILNLAIEKNCKIFARETDRVELENYFTKNVNYLEDNNISFSEVVKKVFENMGETIINNLQPLYIKNSQAERELKLLVKEKSEIKKPIMVQDLVDIENECFTEDIYSIKTFEDELQQPTRKYFVTYYKGKPIAYIGLMIVENEICINKIAVVPEFRRLGLAKKLVDKALQIKSDKNLDTFYLEVNINNKPAISFYQKLGFKIKHERKNYYQNGDSCYVMFYEA